MTEREYMLMCRDYRSQLDLIKERIDNLVEKRNKTHGKDYMELTNRLEYLYQIYNEVAHTYSEVLKYGAFEK